MLREGRKSVIINRSLLYDKFLEYFFGWVKLGCILVTFSPYHFYGAYSL